MFTRGVTKTEINNLFKNKDVNALKMCDIFEQIKPYLSNKAIDICYRINDTCDEDLCDNENGLQCQFLVTSFTSIDTDPIFWSVIPDSVIREFANMINNAGVKGLIEHSCLHTPFVMELANMNDGTKRAMLSFYVFSRYNTAFLKKQSLTSY
jgi:hypothetical protein